MVKKELEKQIGIQFADTIFYVVLKLYWWTNMDERDILIVTKAIMSTSQSGGEEAGIRKEVKYPMQKM